MNHAPSLNILLADDDVDDRIFFEKALRELPIATTLKTFTDGERLMNYLTENYENLPDILFLDLSMPRKTGFECLHEIKEDKKLRNIPVVIFTIPFERTTDFKNTMINSLIGMGAQEHISKPSDFGQLKQMIHDALINAMIKGGK